VLTSRPRLGVLRVLSALAIVAVSCSGSDSTPLVTTAAEPERSPELEPIPATTVPGPVDSEQPETEIWTVAISIDELGAQLESAFDEDRWLTLDPFGDFASCAGLQSAITTYSVLFSAVSGDVSSFGLLSQVSVTAPGIYDANLRIELARGSVVRSTGTMTVDEDLRSGTFLTFDDEGGSFTGTFSCEGAPAPAILDQRLGNTAVDTVEVFVLLTDGDAQRVVGLVYDGSDGEAFCPAIEGRKEDLLLQVGGSRTVGSLTGFELVEGSQPRMSLRAGGITYAIEDVVVDTSPGATSGSFSGTTASGLSADGAFRCT
jgi:hypothetical protein